MHGSSQQWISLAIAAISFFVAIPGKIVYDNAGRLCPMARIVFAVSAPLIVYTMMMFGFYVLAGLLEKWSQSYAPYIAMALALIFAILINIGWYRLLRAIARKTWTAGL